MNEVKTCRKCGEIKSVLSFNKDKTKKFGIGGECKPCASKTAHEYYAKNSTHIKKRVSKYSESYLPKQHRDVISRLKNLCTKAKNRTKEFNLIDLDLLDLWDKQDGRCAYTKLPLLATANQFNTVSLDRVDSSKGYVVGNIQLVCSAINKMKQEYTEEMFLLFCLLVTQNNKLSESPESLLARYVPLGMVDK
jgi:hypothetical protein